MNLQSILGLEVTLEQGTCALQAAWLEPPAVRTLGDMRPVLAGNPPAGGDDRPLYWMYRAAALPQHRAELQARGLRFDLTVLAPGKLAGEEIKTFGHYHPARPGCSDSYPELYGVVYGQAVYLLQRRGGAGIDDVVAVTAGPGDRVFIPPNYGHVTINIGPGPLIMANWVEASFASDYQPYKALGGAAYYYVAGAWNANPRYGALPPLRQTTAAAWPHQLALPEGPFYQTSAEALAALSALV